MLGAHTVAVNGSNGGALFENLVWLTCVEVAIYLRKFRRSDGLPSVGAIRNLVYRGKLKPRRLGRTNYFKRSEIDRALELSIV